MKILRTKSARQDYRDIWEYIAADNAKAADLLIEKIDSKLGLYAEYPHMGRDRDDLGSGVRSFPEGKYVIFYRVLEDGIELLRVIHRARQIKNLWTSPRMVDARR